MSEPVDRLPGGAGASSRRPGTILSSAEKNRDVGSRLCELLDGIYITAVAVSGFLGGRCGGDNRVRGGLMRNQTRIPHILTSHACPCTPAWLYALACEPADSHRVHGQRQIGLRNATWLKPRYFSSRTQSCPLHDASPWDLFSTLRALQSGRFLDPRILE